MSEWNWKSESRKGDRILVVPWSTHPTLVCTPFHAYGILPTHQRLYRRTDTGTVSGSAGLFLAFRLQEIYCSTVIFDLQIEDNWWPLRAPICTHMHRNFMMQYCEVWTCLRWVNGSLTASCSYVVPWILRRHLASREPSRKYIKRQHSFLLQGQFWGMSAKSGTCKSVGHMVGRRYLQKKLRCPDVI